MSYLGLAIILFISRNFNLLFDRLPGNISIKNFEKESRSKNYTLAFQGVRIDAITATAENSPI